MKEKSQLRQHLKFTFKNKFRSFLQKRRIGHLGKHVFLDKNIELLRFPKNISIQNNVIIKEGVRICSCNEHAKISIGCNTTVGYHTFIFSSTSISIGNDCLIAPFVYIVDSDHSIEKSKNINTQANQTAPIQIDDDVWIGTGAKILKGVKIGKGAVIAAGAIVKADVEPYSIMGGIPAKKISERK